MKTIRWGIIGVGDVTEVKSGPGFQKASHSKLVAVMRRNGAAAQDYAVRHNVPRWYDDGAALIDDPEVDAVYVATPPHVHKAYVMMAAAAGKPVYCEKPMALTLSECEEMNAACARAGVPLWVAYYRRQLDKFVQIKQQLDAGTIGDVHMVHVQFVNPVTQMVAGKVPWRFKPEIAGGGRFVDIGSHMLDLLDYFLGPLGDVSGNAINTNELYTAEDNVTATFSLADGAIGSGSWSFTSAESRDETVLYGSRGSISYSCFDDRPAQLVSDGRMLQIRCPFPQHVQQPLIQSIVDELNGQGRCPSDGQSAARTTHVIDQILASYRTRRGL